MARPPDLDIEGLDPPPGTGFVNPGVLADLVAAVEERCGDPTHLRNALAYVALIAAAPLDETVEKQLKEAAAQPGEEGTLLANVLDATAGIDIGDNGQDLRAAVEDRFFSALTARALRIASFRARKPNAEEAAAEAISALYELRATKGALDLWKMAGTVTVRKAVDFHRDPLRRKAGGDLDQVADSVPTVAKPPDSDVLGPMLATLSDEERMILGLWAQGYSFPEIAVVLGKTRDAVAKTAERAKDKLKALVAKE